MDDNYHLWLAQVYDGMSAPDHVLWMSYMLERDAMSDEERDIFISQRALLLERIDAGDLPITASPDAEDEIVVGDDGTIEMIMKHGETH